MPHRCAAHRAYTGRGRPADCATCFELYGRAMVKVLYSTGTARGGGQSSKAKGRSACLLVAALIRETFGLDEGDVFVKTTSQLGVDLHLSPRALAVFPFAPEVKNTETMQIWAALLQATLNAGPHIPIVFFKRAHADLHVALRADAFMQMLKGAYVRSGRNEVDPQVDAEAGDPVR